MSLVSGKIFQSVLVISMVGTFFLSCENDLSQVQKYAVTEDTPDQIVNDLHLIYSDSGIVKFELFANRTEDYTKPKNKRLFKNGFEVRFYGDRDSLVSLLSAEYGEMHQEDSRIIARNNVIFKNFEKNQTLKTEELFWDQARKKVTTDKQFEIFGEKTYARGIGMETDETFSTYVMHKVTLEKELESKDKAE